MLWDVVRRLRLFLHDEFTLRGRGGRPQLQGLWDQGVFTDALRSAALGSAVYPYSYMQDAASPRSAVWRHLRWPTADGATVSDANVSRQHPHGVDGQQPVENSRRVNFYGIEFLEE